MRITKKTITVRELTENYSDDGDNGVYGLNGKTMHPSGISTFFRVFG